jgi:hypothetical protein
MRVEGEEALGCNPAEAGATLNLATPYSAEQVDRLAAQYNRCWPWLSEALRHGGDLHSRDSLWALLLSGRAQLWPLQHSAGVTFGIEYPNARVLQIWLAGGVIDELLAHEPIVAEWGRQNGFTHLEMNGRFGWRRALRKLQWDREALTMTRRL